MMGRTSKIRKYILFFSKNLYFLEEWRLVKNIVGKTFFFFFCYLDIFDGSIGCATKFHTEEIHFFFLSTSVRSKVIAFFVKNLPKLNILSVIAID